MSLFYTAAYWFGIRPWETAAKHEAGRIATMFDREEEGRPYGAALDIGCGTGIQAVELARRGWRVTGVDIVPRAVSAGRDRVRRAGVDVRVMLADVTALRAAGVDIVFQFVLDFGCFHGLNDTQRTAMGREVTAVTVPGSTMLMISWAPGRRGPLPRGASKQDIQAALPEWEMIGEEVLSASALPGPLRNADPRCYRLRRN
jgi:SAM-dependent methyltransferase